MRASRDFWGEFESQGMAFESRFEMCGLCKTLMAVGPFRPVRPFRGGFLACAHTRTRAHTRLQAYAYTSQTSHRSKQPYGRLGFTYLLPLKVPLKKRR